MATFRAGATNSRHKCDGSGPAQVAQISIPCHLCCLTNKKYETVIWKTHDRMRPRPRKNRIALAQKHKPSDVKHSGA